MCQSARGMHLQPVLPRKVENKRPWDLTEEDEINTWKLIERLLTTQN